ncbi:ABC transporter ATP-binding protein [Streptomyces sp. 4N509B]|uniref:ABC transporter ATP-binding protein n=1 Tax=Streptomyces sp. 4N509B TaxID=3457413 RepID=UPI003FD219DC
MTATSPQPTPPPTPQSTPQPSRIPQAAPRPHPDPDAKPPALSFEGVTRPPTLSAPFDLTVRPGEFVALLGAPGSGKSALLTLAAGLGAPATGRVRVDGADLATLPRSELAQLWLSGVARAPQDAGSALDPSLTAVENIALPLELSGVTTRAARRRAVTVLLEMELSEVIEARPDAMSPAQRRAVTVARALAGERRVLLADEPTAGLDGELAETLLALLRLRRPAGAAVLMATSDPRDAAWADRVVVLSPQQADEPGRDATPPGTVTADAPGHPAAPGHGPETVRIAPGDPAPR